ncbi:MAG: hypothetical protein J4G15_17530 [Alphaproteobacteria bacterium]|nr:hypothetical protein [Alphaproteobacteria bacterium]
MSALPRLNVVRERPAPRVRINEAPDACCWQRSDARHFAEANPFVITKE